MVLNLFVKVGIAAAAGVIVAGKIREQKAVMDIVSQQQGMARQAIDAGITAGSAAGVFWLLQKI